MKNFKGKAIYNPSGKAGEYSHWACNFYVGCSNGCIYCYCKKGILAGALGGNEPKLKSCFKNTDHALELFHNELLANKNELQKHGLFFSFTTDPMLPETIELTFDAAKICLINKIPVKILTKCTDWIDSFMKELVNNDTVFGLYYENKKYLAFGFTLTGHDELELNANTNQERIKAIHWLNDEGIKTFASIEPIIDFPSSKRMIEQIADDCDLIKVGLESGKKYNPYEAIVFVDFLNNLKNPKIYLKESLQKLSGYTNSELDEYFVGRDYNIFNI